MKIITYLLVTFFCCFASHAQAKSYPILADVESMQWFKEKSKSLLQSAGIEDEINYRIIRSSEINAFVTPDKNINFFSGLIEKADTEDEVVAVLAHEIGHLKGGHHFSIAHQADKLTLPTIISGIAGVGATLAGAPQAGMALVVGGQAASASQMLRYSRTQEREADHIAFDLLRDNNRSVQGLIDFFGVMKQNELLYSRVPPPYLLSHPLTSARIDAARSYQKKLMENEAFVKNMVEGTDDAENTFLRMKARLFALTHTPAETLRKFPASDKTQPAIYARAIAYAIQGKGDQAITHMNNLVEMSPSNPYFRDMLGQIYVDTGKLNQGIQAFEGALTINPELNLTRLYLAEAYLAVEKLDQSYDHFSIVRQNLPKWPSVWRGLGIVYGKKGFMGESHLALAEEALLKKDRIDAKFHIEAAEKHASNMGKPAQKWLAEVQNALEEK
jgi:predicted Zn-dependent protease